jgi:dihydrofolate synthase/folylpolyglutamate synthase
MPRVGQLDQSARAGEAFREALVRLAGTSEQGMRLGLETTKALCAKLEDPQVGLPGVLVAGTNGKGSVCAVVAEICARAGLRVALLTKPHLTTYRERIQLGGAPIDEARFTAVANQVASAAETMDPTSGRPTHHEMLTAMGFLAARRWGAELMVCEVGLGGRLDATNVWDGGVAVVVSVGLDHQAQLGATVPEIAAEKAAIIKRHDLVVSGAPPEALPAVRAAAKAAAARLWQLGDEISLESGSGASSDFAVKTPVGRREGLRLGLEGAFQLENAALSVAVADCLAELGFPISEGAVREGLAEVRWPGRMQSLGSAPEVLIDAAHNPAAVEAVLPDLRRRSQARPTVLLFGSMADHDHQGMLRLLEQLELEATVFTRSSSARAVPAAELAAAWPGRAEVAEPVAVALAKAAALAGRDGLVVALGSIYVIGEVMVAMGAGEPPDPEGPYAPMW